jgi:hypothetical protein
VRVGPLGRMWRAAGAWRRNARCGNGRELAALEKDVQFWNKRVLGAEQLAERCGRRTAGRFGLLGRGGKLCGGGGGALFGAAFLFDVLGAVGDFIVEGFDFAGQGKIVGIFGVGIEERVSFRFQGIAFFLPDAGDGDHGLPQE